MRTGIPFFDDRELHEGDLVAVLGGPCSGRTTLATALAVGIGRERDVTHFDLEHSREVWRRRVVPMIGDEQSSILYRNNVESGVLPSSLGHAVAIVDTVNLAVPREYIHEFCRLAKQYAVRQNTVVVLTAQLCQELWGHLDAEGWVDPRRLPEWALEFGDQVCLMRRTGAGIAVHRVKGDGNLFSKPGDTCTMITDAEGRLVQTDASVANKTGACGPGY